MLSERLETVGKYKPKHKEHKINDVIIIRRFLTGTIGTRGNASEHKERSVPWLSITETVFQCSASLLHFILFF